MKVFKGLSEKYLNPSSVKEETKFPVGLILAVSALCVISSCTLAHAYSDVQIVKAIYKVEGGKNATYPYGIRSVQCDEERDCRRICLNTVHNNRIRYQRSKSKGELEFIRFLGSKFCPTKGQGLSRAEKSNNKYWIKNMIAVLSKGNK